MKNKVELEKGDSIHFDLSFDINFVNGKKYYYDREEFRLFLEGCIRNYFLVNEIDD